jgi:hypothetical protein
MPPSGPRRPGQVVAAAVLSFVQGGLVLLASVYVFFFASIARVAVLDATGSSASGTVDDLASEGNALALIQVLSVVALIVGGVLALGRRRAALWVLVGALGAQVVLAVYWAVRLNAIGDELPGPDPASAFTWFSVLFAAMPLVALGLLLIGPGRAWFPGRADGAPAGPR